MTKAWVDNRKRYEKDLWFLGLAVNAQDPSENERAREVSLEENRCTVYVKKAGGVRYVYRFPTPDEAGEAVEDHNLGLYDSVEEFIEALSTMGDEDVAQKS